METWTNIDWTDERVLKTLRIAVSILVYVCIGLPLFHLLGVALAGALRGKLSEQSRMLVRKGVFYAGVALVFVTVLNELGFKLAALLGAAGVAGIAIGFASQTSLSNIISGLFLISEKPFAVGDLIRVGDTMGLVWSIDLLSVRLRTFENQLVRIPNENLIKTEVTNVTHFPIRRIDIKVGVAYKENIGRVMDILRDIAVKNPWVLDEPEPVILFTDFGDSSLNLLLGVWAAKEDFLKVKNGVMRGVKERFDAEGIEIPFPHRTVYAGSVTDPFPVRMAPPGARGAEDETRTQGDDTLGAV